MDTAGTQPILAGPNPDQTRLARAAGVSVFAGVLISTLPLGPRPLGVLAGALALTVPGWSLMTVLMPSRQRDRLAEAMTSILISVVLLIAVCLFLDVVGIRIDMRSVSLSILVFEVVVAACLLIRSRRSRSGAANEDLSGDVQRGEGRGDHPIAVGKTVVAWLIGLVTLGVTVGAVALVHRAAPAQVTPPFASISFAGATGAALKVAPLAPGPLVIPVHIGANPAVGGSLVVLLDGSVISSPSPVAVVSSSTLRPKVEIPSLNGCRHQLTVEFRPVGATPVRVVRYVTGPVGSRCPQ